MDLLGRAHPPALVTGDAGGWVLFFMIKQKIIKQKIIETKNEIQ
jgi:hypothetical protein